MWTHVPAESLDMCRLHIFTRLQYECEETITPSVEAAGDPCLYQDCLASEMSAHYMIEMCKLGLWPLTNVLARRRISIRIILKKLCGFKVFSPPENHCICAIQTKGGKDISELARGFELKGLCLDCVKSGRLGGMKDNCMVAPKHGICGHQRTIKQTP